MAAILPEHCRKRWSAGLLTLSLVDSNKVYISTFWILLWLIPEVIIRSYNG